MDIEIVDQPQSFRLWGLSDSVKDRRYGEVGLRLMEQLWDVVRSAPLATTGVNHWVYFADERMFVGAEPMSPSIETLRPSQLAECSFELPRFARHTHVGPYHELPQKWQALRSELESRGETVAMPSLEIYGHCSGDASQAETTILLGLDGAGR